MMFKKMVVILSCISVFSLTSPPLQNSAQASQMIQIGADFEVAQRNRVILQLQVPNQGVSGNLGGFAFEVWEMEFALGVSTEFSGAGYPVQFYDVRITPLKLDLDLQNPSLQGFKFFPVHLGHESQIGLTHATIHAVGFEWNTPAQMQAPVFHVALKTLGFANIEVGSSSHLRNEFSMIGAEMNMSYLYKLGESLVLKFILPSIEATTVGASVIHGDIYASFGMLLGDHLELSLRGGKRFLNEPGLYYKDVNYVRMGFQLHF